MPRTAGNRAVERLLRAFASSGLAASRGDHAPTEPQRVRAVTEVPPIVHDALREPGRPLEPTTRAFMESRYGFDFGGVRVHTTQRAASSAAAVGADAYTVGSDIVFGAEGYAPGTGEGQRLLAHELAHVAQAGGTTPQPNTITLGEAHGRLETEAEQWATGLTRPGMTLVTPSAGGGGVLQRSCRAHGSESFYQTAPNYCKDSWFSGLLHPGKTCYREIPVRTRPHECPPGDQVCFDKRGRCEDSFDRASPVEGKDGTGTCTLNFGCALTLHTLLDVIPGFLDAESAADQLVCEERCMRVGGGAMPWCLQSCRAAQQER